MQQRSGLAGAVIEHDIPPAGEQVGTQEQKTFCHVAGPTRAGSFQAQIDHPPDGTFDTATATGETERPEVLLLHPVGVAFNVVSPLLEGLLAGGFRREGLLNGLPQTRQITLPQQLFPALVEGVPLAHCRGH